MRLVSSARRARQRGNSLVEFALAFGFLFPLVGGTIQFGYSFFVYNQLENAVRQGARYASMKSYNSATTTPPAAFAYEVQNMTVYGTSTAASVPLVRSLTTANVTLTVTFSNGVPKLMTVAIQNYTLDAFLRTFTLNKPSATFAYVGVYAPY